MILKRRIAALVVLMAVAACAPTVMPPGPPVSEPALEDGRLIAADGASLPVRTWMPASGTPEAVIVALHGFNDYRNFFDKPGAWLAERGIATYAYDQRGFGETPVRGMWAGTAALVDDLGAMTRLVQARHPGVPVYLLGASMGGAVIMVAMTGDSPPPAAGIILSGPAVWGRISMPWYQRTALWVAAHTVPWLKVTGRGLRIRASDNIEMLRALGRDPLFIRETRIDSLYGLTDLMDAALASAHGLTGPALILYGENDEIIPRAPVRMMVEGFPEKGTEERRLALYGQGFHMLLRDIQRQTVWQDIAAWITDAKAALPSGADAARIRDWLEGKPR